MIRFIFRPILFLCLVLFMRLTAFAQSADLSGMVHDPTGGPVANAEVRAINSATLVERRAKTNEVGIYDFPFLPPGEYNIVVQVAGFTTAELKKVVLSVEDKRTLDVMLQLGSVNETVTVESGAPVVNTQDGAVGTVVDRQFVANMPMNGRSFQSLIALTPGVTFATAGSNPSTGGQFSVNGQRLNANYFTVDGVSSNYGINSSNGGFIGEAGSGALPALTALGGTNSLVSVDALQEFKIQTSSYAPEFGRTPGGQISLVTRSGTNSFHGTLFNYLRNDVLDANDWFADRNHLTKAKERQNDFGGVVGGPIVKNRTFFFFSYEGLRLRQPVTSIATVPSIQARQLVAQVVKPFFDAFPIPNLPVVGDGLAQFAASYSNPATLNASSIRIDSLLTHKMTLFGTYKHAPSEAQARSGALSWVASSKRQNDAVTTGLVWVISPWMTNDVRFNWSQAQTTSFNTVDSFGGAVVPDDSLLFASPRNRNNAWFVWTAMNSASASAGSLLIGTGQDNIQRQLNLIDALSWVKGTHQLKLGADYRRLSPILGIGADYESLTFSISPQPTVASGQIAAGVGENVAIVNNVSAYVQDTWKVNTRLTATYGLRWEVNAAPYSANGHDPAVLLGLGSTAPATLAPRGTPLYNTQYANFAPRFGLAYQLSRAPGRETVVRGGVGVFYDLGTGTLVNEFGTFFPYFAAKGFSNVSYPLTPSQVQPPVPGVDPPGQFSVAASDLKLPYTVQWNATVDQTLGQNQIVTLSYVGSSGQRLLRDFSALRTLVAGFGSTSILYSLTTNDGWSSYRALQAQLRRRLSKGVQGLLSYTWARSYDTSSSDNASTEIVNSLVSSTQNYGPSDFDVRHTISGALMMDFPAVRGSRPIAAITRGWGLDSLLRFRTALPTNLRANNLIGGLSANNHPNVVPGVPQVLFGSQYPGGKAVNPAAFSPPSNDTVGNSPRNSLRFFNASQLDVAMRREFALMENLRLQARVEFFNILNHPNFADPTGFSAGANVSTQVLSRGLGGLNPLYQIGGPRSGQVSLKLIF